MALVVAVVARRDDNNNNNNNTHTYVIHMGHHGDIGRGAGGV